MARKKVIKVVLQYGNSKKTIKSTNPDYVVNRIRTITKGW